MRIGSYYVTWIIRVFVTWGTVVISNLIHQIDDRICYISHRSMATSMANGESDEHQRINCPEDQFAKVNVARKLYLSVLKAGWQQMKREVENALA